MTTPSFRSIGICGVGLMGTGVAVCFKRAGYKVLAWDRDSERLAQVQGVALENWLDDNIGPAPLAGGTIQTRDLGVLTKESDIFIECITEDMDQKVALITGLAKEASRGAIFLTVTSGLSITEMGRRSGVGSRLAGTHFWNPPHLMPLVEVVRGQETAHDVLDSVCDLIRSIGKAVVRVDRDIPGFIGNRLLHALFREAIYLVQEKIASAEDIDQVARLTFGLRMAALGPLENMDLVGLDLIHSIHDYLLADLADDHEPPRILKALVAQGSLGAKTGRGFYDWVDHDARELLAKRDGHILRQLRELKEIADIRLRKPG